MKPEPPPDTVCHVGAFPDPLLVNTCPLLPALPLSVKPEVRFKLVIPALPFMVNPANVGDALVFVLKVLLET